MPVPNTFANATATIPLSQLDANFATTITLGNTAIQLGNTVSTLNNMTLANVTVTSGNVTLTNVTVTTANVTTANTTTLVVTGNTTLGDASTDTVTVNGTMGVGGAGAAGTAIKISGTQGVATTANGFLAQYTGASTSTNYIAGFQAYLSTSASSYTVSNVYGFAAAGIETKGAGSTITNLHGFYVFDQTQGTNNYGITSLVSSGTNKWNIYASGTAANYFAGNVLVGTTAARSVGGASRLFQVEGTSATTTGASLFRNSNDAGAAALSFGKSRGTAVGGTTIVASGDSLGGIFWSGSDGTNQITAGQIVIEVDGTPGTNDMPGRLVFSTTADGGSSPTERMRLDSAGNLGLGVTPSAWTTYKAIQLGATTPFAIDSSGAIGINYYYDGAYKYFGTGAATLYSTAAGQHRWYTAPSGTAGNAITFTQAMTLDASGRLLVGTTANRANNFSSGSFFQLEATSSAASSAIIRNSADTSGGVAVLGKSRGTTVGSFTAVASGDTVGAVSFQGADGTALIPAAGIFAAVDGTPGTNDMPGRLVFSTTADGASSVTERMRIDSSGNVGIGTGAPSYTTANRVVLQVNGSTSSLLGLAYGGTNAGYLYADSTGTTLWSEGSRTLTVGVASTGNVEFKTNNTERARITSGGYFKTANDGNYNDAAGNYCEFLNTNNNQILRLAASNASYTSSGIELLISRNTTNNTFYAFSYYNTGAAAFKFRVADSGNCTNTNGSYGTISDAKMKTDIVDAASQWDDIKAIRFRKFKMVDDPEQIVQLGVVAQEIELTSPGLVEEHADKDAEGNDLGTTTKSVKTSVMLMKAAVALQEAMNRIEQLEAKVAALEAK
jgi:hypothetical protein